MMKMKLSFIDNFNSKLRTMTRNWEGRLGIQEKGNDQLRLEENLENGM